MRHMKMVGCIGQLLGRTQGAELRGWRTNLLWGGNPFARIATGGGQQDRSLHVVTTDQRPVMPQKRTASCGRFVGSEQMSLGSRGPKQSDQSSQASNELFRAARVIPSGGLQRSLLRAVGSNPTRPQQFARSLEAVRATSCAMPHATTTKRPTDGVCLVLLPFVWETYGRAATASSSSLPPSCVGLCAARLSARTWRLNASGPATRF